MDESFTKSFKYSTYDFYPIGRFFITIGTLIFRQYLPIGGQLFRLISICMRFLSEQ